MIVGQIIFPTPKMSFGKPRLIKIAEGHHNTHQVNVTLLYNQQMHSQSYVIPFSKSSESIWIQSNIMPERITSASHDLETHPPTMAVLTSYHIPMDQLISLLRKLNIKA